MEQTKPKGLILKEARLARGITLDTVQEATKIPLDVLKAIEEGYTVKSVSPFYFKGFLRMYARFLHLDEKAIVDDYRLEKTPAEPFKRHEQPLEFDLKAPAFNRDQLQFFMKVGVVLLGVFIVVKVFGMVFHKKEPRTAKRTAVAKQTAKSQESAPVTTAPVKEKAAKAQTSEPAKKETSPVVAPVVKESSGGEQKISIPAENLSRVSLAVKPKANAWVQVKVDGAVVYQSTLKKGVPESWTAKDRIELSGKDIDNLEYEINGKMIGSLGRSDAQARRLIVTKEGLTVKK